VATGIEMMASNKDASRTGATTLEPGNTRPNSSAHPEANSALALVVVWWRDDPSRLGEVFFPGAACEYFGRWTGADDSGSRLVRQRPGGNEPAAPLVDPRLSRRHLRVHASSALALSVQNLGKRAMLVNGSERDSVGVSIGDVLTIDRLCTFLAVRRPLRLPGVGVAHGFGEADTNGIIGESPAAWEIRQRIAFVASRSAHVLVTGPSGTGKELVARAVHCRSSRGGREVVARNAATIPATLIDAELFGNAANYPNAGMSERAGLIGRAHGSTLVLDEIGELPIDAQAHLLRVLDAGEYQRLGDARCRSADFRLIGMTNRAPEQLKPDLAARFPLSIAVPGLEHRLEDVPMIARHIVRRIAGSDPALGARYLAGWNGSSGEPRFTVELIHSLLSQQYCAHVRELEQLLWISLRSSPGDALDCTPDMRDALRSGRTHRDPEAVSREELRAALSRHAGVKEHVWRDLGLSSRHALNRLISKLGEHP
jgi:transcriptional regulator with PAS, ATPase and Fis domain